MRLFLSDYSNSTIQNDFGKPAKTYILKFLYNFNFFLVIRFINVI